MPSYDLDAQLTSPQAIAFFAGVGVTITKQAIYSWRRHGLRVIGLARCRHCTTDPSQCKSTQPHQPLYRLGDLLDTERRTRTNPKSTRHPSRGRLAA